MILFMRQRAERFSINIAGKFACILDAQDIAQRAYCIKNSGCQKIKEFKFIKIRQINKRFRINGIQQSVIPLVVTLKIINCF